MTHKRKLPTTKDNWETPNWLFNQLDSRFDFTVDAAATSENTKVFVAGKKCFFDDGLVRNWGGERVFCNPPFSDKTTWIKKAYDEVFLGICPLCVMILPASIENKVYHEYIFSKGIHWEPLEKRVSFIDPDTKKPKSGNTQGTIIVYFWKTLWSN